MRLPLRAYRHLLLLVTASILAFGVAAWNYLDQIYFAVAYEKISREQTAGIDPADTEAVVARLFGYAYNAMDGAMMPGDSLPSFKYLEAGFGFCDQQSDALMNLLYHRGVTARVVPLFKSDGTSDHTLAEWHDGSKWRLIDILNNQSLPVSATELLTLPKEELVAGYGLDPEAYDFYAGLHFEALSNTYLTGGSYKYWGPLHEKKVAASKAFDKVASVFMRVSPERIPRLIQEAYIWKNYPEVTAEGRYMAARNRMLFGDAEYALATFEGLHEAEGLPDEWPGFREFNMNKSMLRKNLEIIRADNDFPVYSGRGS